jgi:hypothetical protein
VTTVGRVILARLVLVVCLISGCTREPSATVLPPDAGASSVAGTTWRFPPSKSRIALPDGGDGSTSVAFLADGTVSFEGLPPGSSTGGHWKQDGAALVFDCNDFTEYRVVISGNEMKGTWMRLRGDDKGHTSTTSLVRDGP